MKHGDLERELAELGQYADKQHERIAELFEQERYTAGCIAGGSLAREIQRRLAGLIATLDAEREAGRAK